MQTKLKMSQIKIISKKQEEEAIKLMNQLQRM